MVWQEVDDVGEHSADEDADDSADGAESYRFSGELREQRPFGGADSFADADFAGALVAPLTEA